MAFVLRPKFIVKTESFLSAKKVEISMALNQQSRPPKQAHLNTRNIFVTVPI